MYKKHEKGTHAEDKNYCMSFGVLKIGSYGNRSCALKDSLT
jgi:hypothetical protein